MTNAEVYIGDEDLIYTFIDEFSEFACEQDCDFKYHYLKETLVRFFKKERKPTLTDDERVILRNLWHRFDIIKRLESGLLVVEYQGLTRADINIFDHLFKFIKERRRILNRRIIRR